MARTPTASPVRSKRPSGGHGASQSTRKKGKQALAGNWVKTPQQKKAPAAKVSATKRARTALEKSITLTIKGSPSSGRFTPNAEGFETLYKAPVMKQVEWAKSGIGARDAKAMLDELRLTLGEALNALHIPAATLNRKAKTNAPLSPAEGERVLGVGRLLGQVQTMVRESGNPEGFDAAAWLSAWMSEPVPALGGARPLDLMDTMTGQALVSQVLAQMQSGAYA